MWPLVLSHVFVAVLTGALKVCRMLLEHMSTNKELPAETVMTRKLSFETPLMHLFVPQDVSTRIFDVVHQAFLPLSL